VDEIVDQEMTPADLGATLARRDEVFPPAPIVAADWLRERMLASVATGGDDVSGAIPSAMRQLVAAPGVLISAPFASSVGTREAFRSRGSGAAMITAARDSTHDRADGNFVFQGGRTIA